MPPDDHAFVNPWEADGYVAPHEVILDENGNPTDEFIAQNFGSDGHSGGALAWQWDDNANNGLGGMVLKPVDGYVPPGGMPGQPTKGEDGLWYNPDGTLAEGYIPPEEGGPGGPGPGHHAPPAWEDPTHPDYDPRLDPYNVGFDPVYASSNPHPDMINSGLLGQVGEVIGADGDFVDVDAILDIIEDPNHPEYEAALFQWEKLVNTNPEAAAGMMVSAQGYSGEHFSSTATFETTHGVASASTWNDISEDQKYAGQNLEQIAEITGIASQAEQAVEQALSNLGIDIDIPSADVQLVTTTIMGNLGTSEAESVTVSDVASTYMTNPANVAMLSVAAAKAGITFSEVSNEVLDIALNPNSISEMSSKHPDSTSSELAEATAEAGAVSSATSFGKSFMEGISTSSARIAVQTENQSNIVTGADLENAYDRLDDETKFKVDSGTRYTTRKRPDGGFNMILSGQGTDPTAAKEAARKEAITTIKSLNSDVPEDWNPLTEFNYDYLSMGYKNPGNTWIADYQGKIPGVDPTDEQRNDAYNRLLGDIQYKIDTGGTYTMEKSAGASGASAFNMVYTEGGDDPDKAKEAARVEAIKNIKAAHSDLPEDWNPSTPFNYSYMSNGYKNPGNHWKADYQGDLRYRLSVSNSSATEGDKIEFTLTLSRAATETVIVNYTTQNGSASSNDYTSTSGSVTFAIGETTKKVSIATTDDTTHEANETFSVNFSSGQINANVTATGTINNDDAKPVDTSVETFVYTTTANSVPYIYTDQYALGGIILESPVPDGVSASDQTVTITNPSNGDPIKNGDTVSFSYYGGSVAGKIQVNVTFNNLPARSNETEWKPSWERGGNENKVSHENKVSEWKPTWERDNKRHSWERDNKSVGGRITNNKKLMAPAKKTRGYRAVSQDVKARVLLKVNNIISAFSQDIILGLGRDGDSVDDIIGSGLTKAVQTSQHPDLILTQRSAQGDSGYSGVKRAVIIGINYALNSKLNTLSGCINDATAMRGMLIDTYAYKTENIKVLRDDLQVVDTLPTRANILQSIRDVVSASEDKDEIWLHFSGHGSYVVDEGNDEVDKRDEGIVSSDFDDDSIKVILDDELKTLLNGVKGTVMITQDCCNSGTGWDLPYMYTRQANGSYSRSVEGARFSQTTTKNIYMLSGSRDDQLAVETGDRLGAFTDSLMECLRRRNHTVSLFNLENDINELLKERNLEQRTVFTSANYSASLANISRNMIMSSSAPDYRKGFVRNIPVNTFQQQRKEKAINMMRSMMFTFSNKHLK